VRSAGPVLPDFDPGPEVRRGVRGHACHLPRLRAAARDLARFTNLDEPASRKALDARLALLRRALWRSPFCAARLRERGLSPEDLRSLDALRHFPVLEREALGRSFFEMPALPRACERRRLFADRSSGSTGQPIAVIKEGYDAVHMWAVVRFWLRRLGLRVPRQPRVALLCTLPHGVEYWTRLPAFGGGMLKRISVARPEPAGRLEEFRPHVLFSDPAGLHWLLGQPRRPRPRLVLSSAMHLSAHLRRRAERALGCPVLNYYSSAETGPIAWECRRRAGLFHVLLPDVWVESEDGELLVTRLRDSVLPLLRYRVGDRGRVRVGCCGCGHRGLTITGLSGRRACSFVTPDGRAVDAWQLAWALQHHPLDRFRLVQQTRGVFRLETAADADAAAVAAVRHRLRGSLVALGWKAPRLEWRRVASDALAAAKPEPFVCRVAAGAHR
jgi:phenylacetate-CoA ligase